MGLAGARALTDRAARAQVAVGKRRPSCPVAPTHARALSKWSEPINTRGTGLKKAPMAGGESQMGAGPGPSGQ